MERINEFVFGAFLIAAAWEDLQRKSISIWLFLCAGASGIVFCFLQGEYLIGRLSGCLVGLVLLAVSRLSKEAIGAGDGCFFIVSGLFFPVLFNLKLLIYGISLSGLVCGAYYMVSRVRGLYVGKEKVPFIPFLVPVWFFMVLI